MLKKLDLYIIKTFLGPFIFIFSILFFIFMVNIIWIQMFNLGGKGLTTWELTKLFYYLSVGVIKMVLPLTILLASIMAFGGFGERYELAAMKAAANESFGYTEEELVSSDIIGLSEGSLFDATQTRVMTVGDKQLVKTVAWYDNEMSYTNQLIRTLTYFASLIKSGSPSEKTAR